MKTTQQVPGKGGGCSPVQAGLALPPGQGCSAPSSLNSHSHCGGTRCRDVWNTKSGLKQRGKEGGRAEGRSVPSLFHTF